MGGPRIEQWLRLPEHTEGGFGRPLLSCADYSAWSSPSAIA